MKSFHPRLQNLVLAAALNAAFVTPALATPAGPSFKTADRNGDGLISQKEFADQGGYKQAFQKGDANLDYHLDKNEFIVARAHNEKLKTGQYADDAWITDQVKTQLLKDKSVEGVDVNVETHQGTVQLSGRVNDATQIALAEFVAIGVEGVKDIRNELQVRY